MSTTATMGTDIKHLDSTIELIDEHVKKESTANVSTSINSWIKTLSEYDDLKDIAGDLEKLKEAIAQKDGKQIVNLMTSLGKATTAAAEQAEGDEGKKIKMLGMGLSTAAKAISKIA